MEGPKLRRGLVQRLERASAIRSAAVRDAFLAVPRERFLPAYAAREGLAAVYLDEAIPTRRDAQGSPTSSSSQPAIMALMLEALSLEPGQRVLEVGAGTGYNAALIATVAGPEAEVVSVELDPETAEEARQALEGYGVEVVVGDGRLGWPAAAPYDRAIVTAGAEGVEPAWHEQLVEGGILVVPLNVSAGAAQVIPALRREGPRLRSVAVLCGGFMPLRTTPDEVVEPPAGIDLPVRGGSTHLGGAALDPQGRESLAAALAEAPRERPLDLRVTRWSLALYLALEAPAGRFVGGPAGIGLVGRDGSGLALVLERRGRPRLAAWGDPEPAETLDALLAGWRELGEPTESELGAVLELTVEPGHGDTALRHRWRPHCVRPHLPLRSESAHRRG